MDDGSNPSPQRFTQRVMEQQICAAEGAVALTIMILQEGTPTNNSFLIVLQAHNALLQRMVAGLFVE